MVGLRKSNLFLKKLIKNQATTKFIKEWEIFLRTKTKII